MKLPRFSLRRLAYFAEAARSGTISEAAICLNISQSALSDALTELERELGLQLLIRQRARGIRLTEAGRGVLIEARSLLKQADELQSGAQKRGQGLAGDLSVGCYPTLMPFLMPRLIAGFQELCPDIVLHFVEQTQERLGARLTQGEIELSLTYDIELPAGVVVEELYRLRPYVLLPAAHPRAGDGSVLLGTLAGEPLILLDLPPSRQHTTRVFAEAALSPTPSHRVASFELVRAMVARGLGYAVLMQRPAGNVSYEGLEVAPVAIADAIAEMPIVLVRSPDLAPSRRAQAFATFCRDLLTPGHKSGNSDNCGQ